MKKIVALSVMALSAHLAAAPMNGNEVHSWNAEGLPPVLLDPALTGGKRGNVLVQLASTPGSFNQGNDLNNQAIGELDWNSNVVWQWSAGGSAQDAYAAPVEGRASAQVPGGSAKQHQDWRRLKNGNTLVLANLVNNMSVLRANKWYDSGDQRFHPDNILIDSREANFIVIIDKQTGKVVWNLGPDYPEQVRGPRVLEIDMVPYHWVPESTPRSQKAVIPLEPGKFRIATQ